MWHIHVNRDSIDKLQDTVATFQKDLETNHEKMKKMIKGIKEKQIGIKKKIDEDYSSMAQICRLREETEVWLTTCWYFPYNQSRRPVNQMQEPPALTHFQNRHFPDYYLKLTTPI